MPEVWVSNGEFADKWTILEIKLGMFTSETQKANVQVELGLLTEAYQILSSNPRLIDLIAQLKSTNLEIWNLMDSIYNMKEPTERYAKLSLEITFQNQKRAFIKREIDKESGSETSEEKSYFTNVAQLVDEDNS